MTENKIYGHRGYSEKYPENSLLAFSKAFEMGASGVECDLQKTKDGKFIILHDDSVDRTSINKKGNINAMTLDQIKECDLGYNQKIPELKELLAIIPGSKFLNIELKIETITKDDCPLIHEILKEKIDTKKLMISSFSPELLTYFKKQKITVGLLFGSECLKKGLLGIFVMIFKLNPQYLNLPVKMFELIGTPLSLLFTGLMKLFGKKIAFWTINSFQELKKVQWLSRLLITDRVGYILSSLNSNSQQELS